MSSGYSESSFSTMLQRPQLDYEGPNVRCFCGHRAARWVSWSDHNPARIFYKCPSSESKFWRWAEEALSNRAKEVIIALRDKERKLIEVNRDLMVENRELKLVVEKNREILGMDSCLSS